MARKSRSDSDRSGENYGILQKETTSKPNEQFTFFHLLLVSLAGFSQLSTSSDSPKVEAKADAFVSKWDKVEQNALVSVSWSVAWRIWEFFGDLVERSAKNKKAT